MEENSRILELSINAEEFNAQLNSIAKSLDIFSTNIDRFESKINSMNINGNFSKLDSNIQSMSKTSNKYLSSISESANTLNDTFEGKVLSSLNKIAGEFTVLGKVGDEITRNLIRQFGSMSSSIVKSMTDVDNLSAALSKYEQKNTSIRTIMNSVMDDSVPKAYAKKIDYVTDALSKLETFSDETSYDFTQMTQTISKFTALGNSLEKASKTAIGMANWASLVGKSASDYESLAWTMEKVAGLGYVGLQQYQSLSTYMDPQTKTKIMESAAALGTLKKQADGTFKTLKGESVSLETFSTNLSEKWLTMNVLNDVMDQYSSFSNAVIDMMDEQGVTASEAIKKLEAANKISKQFDETAIKAFKSAQEAKNFGEAIQSVKVAVTTGWAKSFEYLFGNVEEASKIFTDLANQLYEIFAESKYVRNEVLKIWSNLGGRDTLFSALLGEVQTSSDGIEERVGGLVSIIGEYLTTIKEAIGDVFGLLHDDALEDNAKGVQSFAENLYNLTKRFNEFVKTLKPSEEQLQHLRDIVYGITLIFKGFLIATKTSISGIIKIISSMMPYINQIEALIGEFIYTAVSRLYPKIKVTCNLLKKILAPILSTLVNKVGSKLVVILNELNPILSSLINFIGDLIDKFNTFLEKTFIVDDSVSNLKKNFIDLILSIDILSWLNKISTAFSNFIKNFNLSDVFKNIQKSFSNFTKNFKLDDIFKNVSKAFSNFTKNFKLDDIFKNISKAFSNFIKNIQKVKIGDIFKNITNTFNNITKKLGLENIFKSLSSSINKILKSTGLDKIGEAISNILSNIFKPFQKIKSVTIGDTISALIDKVSLIFGKITNFSKQNNLKNSKKAIDPFNVLADILQTIINIIKNIFSFFNDQGSLQLGLIFGIVTMIYKNVKNITATINQINAIKMKKVQNTQILLAIAGVVVITAALMTLSTIKQEDLIKSVVALSAIILVISAMSLLYSKLSGVKNINFAVVNPFQGFLPFAITLIAFVFAVQKISDMLKKNPVQTMAIIVTIIALLSLYFIKINANLSDMAKNTEALNRNTNTILASNKGSAFKTLVTLITGIVSLIEYSKEMNFKEALKLLATVVVGITALGVAFVLISKAMKVLNVNANNMSFNSSGLAGLANMNFSGMIMLSSSINTLTGSLKQLATVPFLSLAAGTASLVILFTTLAAYSPQITMISPALMNLTIMLASFAISIKLIGGSISGVLNFAAAMGVLVASIFALHKVFTSAEPSIKNVITLIGSLAIIIISLTASVVLLNNARSGLVNFVVVLASVAVAIGALVLIVKSAKDSISNLVSLLLTFSVTVLSIAFSIQIMSTALIAVGNNASKCGLALLIIAGAVAAISLAATPLLPLLDGIGAAIQAAAESAMMATKTISSIISGKFNFKGIGESISNFFKDIPGALSNLVKSIPDLLAKAGDALSKFGSYLVTNFPIWISKAGTALSQFGSKLLANIPVWFSNIGNFISTNVPKLVSKVGAALGQFGEWITKNVPVLLSKVGNALGQLSSYLAKNVPIIFSKIGGWILETGPKILTAMKDIGGFIVSGLINGIASLPGKIVEFFTQIPKAVEGVFAIASPSKVFEGIGKYVGEGFINGITSIGKAILDAVLGVFTVIPNAVADVLSKIPMFKGFADSIRTDSKATANSIKAEAKTISDSVNDVTKHVSDSVKEIPKVINLTELFNDKNNGFDLTKIQKEATSLRESLNQGLDPNSLAGKNTLTNLSTLQSAMKGAINNGATADPKNIERLQEINKLLNESREIASKSATYKKTYSDQSKEDKKEPATFSDLKGELTNSALEVGDSLQHVVDSNFSGTSMLQAIFGGSEEGYKEVGNEIIADVGSIATSAKEEVANKVKEGGSLLETLFTDPNGNIVNVTKDKITSATSQIMEGVNTFNPMDYIDFSSIFNSLKGIFGSVIQIFNDVLPVVTSNINSIIDIIINQAVPVFMQIFDTVGTIFTTVMETLYSVWDAVSAAFMAIGSAIMTPVITVYDLVKHEVETVLAFIDTLLSKIAESKIINGIVQGIFNIIKFSIEQSIKFVQSFADKLSFIANIVQIIGAVFSTVFQILRIGFLAIRIAFEAVIVVAHSILDFIEKKIIAAFNVVVDFVSGVIGWFIEKFTAVKDIITGFIEKIFPKSEDNKPSIFQTIYDGIKMVYDFLIKNGVVKLFGNVLDFVTGIKNGVKGFGDRLEYFANTGKWPSDSDLEQSEQPEEGKEDNKSTNLDKIPDANKDNGDKDNGGKEGKDGKEGKPDEEDPLKGLSSGGGTGEKYDLTKDYKEQIKAFNTYAKQMSTDHKELYDELFGQQANYSQNAIDEETLWLDNLATTYEAADDSFNDYLDNMDKSATAEDKIWARRYEAMKKWQSEYANVNSGFSFDLTGSNAFKQEKSELTASQVKDNLYSYISGYKGFIKNIENIAALDPNSVQDSFIKALWTSGPNGDLYKNVANMSDKQIEEFASLYSAVQGTASEDNAILDRILKNRAALRKQKLEGKTVEMTDMENELFGKFGNIEATGANSALNGNDNSSRKNQLTQLEKKASDLEDTYNKKEAYWIQMQNTYGEISDEAAAAEKEKNKAYEAWQKAKERATEYEQKYNLDDDEALKPEEDDEGTVTTDDNTTDENTDPNAAFSTGVYKAENFVNASEVEQGKIKAAADNLSKAVDDGLAEVNKKTEISVAQANATTDQTAAQTEGSQSALAALLGQFKPDEVATAMNNLAVIVTQINTLFQAMKSAMDLFSQTGDSGSSPWMTTGENIDNQIAQGITQNIGACENAVSEMLQRVIATARAELGIASPSKEFYDIGAFVVEGLCNGILDGESSIVQAMYDALEAMEEEAEEEEEINSPSKKWYRFGNYIDEGLANGISDNTFKPINELSTVLSNLSDDMSMDDDFNPVITPVLDLSTAKQQAGGISTLFANKQALSISSKLNSQNNQNGGNGSVINNYTFTQNNTSPTALNDAEIYRQTKSQFNIFKDKVGRK